MGFPRIPYQYGIDSPKQPAGNAASGYTPEQARNRYRGHPDPTGTTCTNSRSVRHTASRSLPGGGHNAISPYCTRDISPIPSDSEIVICHNGLRLKPSSRFQDCNLPHEPTLHVRFNSHLDGLPRNEPTQFAPVDVVVDPPTAPMENSLLEETCRETQQDKQTTGKAEGDICMLLGISLSQTFFLDLEGKTHVLLFSPQDSITENLLRHSPQLHLPPLSELYILSGSHIMRTECTGAENSLHHEPHLKILVRCRGGMRGGSNGSPQGGSEGRGRGLRSPGGEGRQRGGSYGSEENSNHTTPCYDVV